MTVTAADVAVVRHVVQQILVPCVFVIGLLGNSVSIYVLTRKRMRCTTNIYLTALAITDIIYLTMALLLSLKHYDYVQRHCEAYWMFYGMLVWLCDACAYISIYIAVCFTIERFIAIRYPLKRQTFCTESLAKKVIAGVALFCVLSTISTAFEHKYAMRTKLIDGNGAPCNVTLANAAAAVNGTPSAYAPAPSPLHVTTPAQLQQQIQATTVATPMTTTTTTTTATPIKRLSSMLGAHNADGIWQAAGSGAGSGDDTGGAGAGAGASAGMAAAAPLHLMARLQQLQQHRQHHQQEQQKQLQKRHATTSIISYNNNNSNSNTTNEGATLQTISSTGSSNNGRQLKANIPSASFATLPLEYSIDLLLDHTQALQATLATMAATPPKEHADEADDDAVSLSELPVYDDILHRIRMASLNGNGHHSKLSLSQQQQLQEQQHAEQEQFKAQDDVVTVPAITSFNITFYCENVTYYQNVYSTLAMNVLYTNIWYSFTSFVFVFIPLCVLATFNCFLIMLVRRSKSLRGEMTNANSIRRPRQRKSASSVSQENRVTVTLIAVVLLFIICQLPWAIYLIVSEQIDIHDNLRTIYGNVFNFLAAINAAANFFLYCVLSDKYRKTVRELITGYKYRPQYTMPRASASLYAHSHHGGSSAGGSVRGSSSIGPGHSTTVNGSRRYQRATMPTASITTTSAASTMVIK